MSAITDARNARAMKRRQKQNYNPGRDESEMVQFVCDQVAAGEDARQNWSQNAWLGLSYTQGHQWARYDQSKRRILNDTPKRYEYRMVLNHTAPICDTLVAKLTQHKPGWFCVPQSNEEADIAKADACTRRLEYEYRVQNMRTRGVDLVRWAVQTGTGIYRVSWDPTAGDPFVDPDTGETIIPGQPSVEVVPPLLTYFDPGCTQPDLRDCRWVAEIRYLHIDEVEARWPKGKYVQPDTCVHGDNFSAQLLNDHRADPGKKNLDLSDRVKVIAYYERSSKRHPKGLYVVTANGMVLEETELPFDILPFVLIRFYASPGKLFGQGIPERARATQDMINHQISKRLQAVALVAAPKWTAEEGSIKQSAITSEPGEVIMHRPGTPRPQPANPPQVSPQHAALTAEGIAMMREICGVNDISLGSVPAALSGRAAQWQAEQDASKFAPISGEIEEAYARLGSLMLRMIHAYAPPQQTLRIIGEDKRVETIEFHTSDITSYDVYVTEGSMAVKHPSVMRETVLLGWRDGLYGDKSNPDNIANARKDMGWGNTDYLYGNNDAETNYAKEENYLFLNGSSSTVMPWEDHAKHVFCHRKALMSTEFRRLPPEQQMAFATHVAEHEKRAFEASQGKPWFVELVGPPDLAPPEQPEQGAPPAAPEQQNYDDIEEAFGPDEFDEDEQSSVRGPGVSNYDTAPDEPELFEPGVRQED